MAVSGTITRKTKQMSKGFFTKKETESTSRVDGKPATCAACGLLKTAENPCMKPRGFFSKKILIITDSIAEKEDKGGIYLNDQDGRWLINQFSHIGVDVEKDCITVSSCMCFSPETPTLSQTGNCRRKILSLINAMKPHLIVPVGMNAMFALIGHRWKKDLGDIDKWRGWAIPDQDFNCWITPVWNHRWVYENREKQEVLTVWKQDMDRIQYHIGQPLRTYVEPKIRYMKTPEFLNREKFQSGRAAFDYETTSIKPYNRGNRVACVGIAVSETEVYVFPIPKTKQEREPFLNWLKNKNVSKIAQNMKFETLWSKEALRTDVEGWEWDTMLASHLLDNRVGVTGLKFQAYVQLGIIDYDSSVIQYLQSKKGEETNRVMEAMENESTRNELLKYCALDALYEFRLAMIQMKVMNYNDLPF